MRQQDPSGAAVSSYPLQNAFLRAYYAFLRAYYAPSTLLMLECVQRMANSLRTGLLFEHVCASPVLL